MIEYKDNESYERDKADLISSLDLHFKNEWSLACIDIPDVLNLLRQSKWVGKVAEAIKPLPVVRDKYGKLIKDYDERDWLVKLNEEYHEVTEQIILEDTTRAAEELQDFITVCTSMQQWLGFDSTSRDELTREINEKNRTRGYFEEN